MPYIGAKQLKASNLKRFSVTGSTSATHVLTWTAPNEQSLIITINGVKQHDGAYTISGSPTTITLSSALVATDEMEVIGINDIGTTITPAQNSVNTDKIADNAVTTAKIADDQVTSAKLANAINITSGNSLTIDSGATITNNGTASGFGSNTPAFSACMNTNTTLSAANTFYKASFDTELLDTDGAFDTSTYRFTVPSGKAGKYFFTASITVYNSASGWIEDTIKIYKNGSAVNRVSQYSYKYTSAVTASVILDLVAGDYIEVYGATSTASGTNFILGSADQGSFAGFRMVE